jgi:hypothetical protein
MSRIVAICPQAFPGVSAVFKNGAKLGLWDFIYLGDRIPLDATFLILGGWINSYYEFLGNPALLVAVYLTSTIAQMEFSLNQIELLQVREIGKLLEKNLIKYVLAGWQDVIDFPFKKFKEDQRAFYCPYPINLEFKRFDFRLKINKSIGLFSPQAVRKNLQNQVLAALHSGELHTNLRIASGRIKHHYWLPDDEYHKLIGSLWVTLHCGFSESLCYAAVESILAGTVPIISLQVAQNLSIPDDFATVVKQVDSARNIAKKIEQVLSWHPSEYAARLVYLEERIQKTAEINNEKIKKILDKVTT